MRTSSHVMDHIPLLIYNVLEDLALLKAHSQYQQKVPNEP